MKYVKHFKEVFNGILALITIEVFLISCFFKINFYLRKHNLVCCKTLSYIKFAISGKNDLLLFFSQENPAGLCRQCS